jgi:tetratricopeptide (TPR) repeat protein
MLRRRPLRVFSNGPGLALIVVAFACGACGKPPSPVEQAVLLSEKGQDQAAVQVLEAHIGRHAGALVERRLLIRLLAATGDMGRAEREAGALAKLLPADSPVPWLELGRALEMAHRFDEALALYDRAAEVSPHDPEGPRTGGLRAARWGEMALAEPRLREALRRDPRASAVWHAYGLVKLQLGDLDAARSAYQSGLVADPTALENRIGLATVALKRGDARAALLEYERVLAERPGFVDGYLGKAWALIVLGRYDEARAVLDDARRHGASERATARQESLLKSLVDKSKRGLNP